MSYTYNVEKNGITYLLPNVNYLLNYIKDELLEGRRNPNHKELTYTAINVETGATTLIDITPLEQATYQVSTHTGEDDDTFTVTLPAEPTNLILSDHHTRLEWDLSTLPELAAVIGKHWPVVFHGQLVAQDIRTALITALAAGVRAINEGNLPDPGTWLLGVENIIDIIEVTEWQPQLHVTLS